MEKPSKVRFQDKLGLGIDQTSQKAYTTDTVSIRSLLDAVVKVTGTVTGNTYTWPHAGAILDVDIRDKDEILDKKRGKACCGGQSGASLFELV